MNQLDMIKAFAELEGVILKDDGCGTFFTKDNCGNFMFNGGSYSMYNPITDLALNCAAMLKYKVSIYRGNLGDKGMVCSNHAAYAVWRADVSFENNDGAPRAIIECILKSEGKWK